MVSSIMWEALKREVSLGEGWLCSDVLYKFDLILLQAIFFFTAIFQNTIRGIGDS